MKETLYLLDLLAQADVDAPDARYVEAQPMVLNRVSRMALFQHPDSSVTFPPIQLGSQPSLAFDVGMSQVVWKRFRGVARFRLSLLIDGQEHLLFDTRLIPLLLPWHRKWMPHTIDLSHFAGQSVRLRFHTRVRGPSAYAWAAWADPALTHEIADRVTVTRPDRHRHVFLITADALSRRFLGCYGAEQPSTPNIDQLATHSVLFEQAWSQSTVTLSSYVSMLTGLYPHEHGVTAEWGSFQAGEKTHLMGVLRSRGYHSALFYSETDLAKPEVGISQAFDMQPPAIANPAQDGAMTIRQLSRWLDQRPDQPLFCWLQFFDTHPPNLAPPGFLKPYYDGSPTRGRVQPEQIKSIHGIETRQDLEVALDLLKQGFIGAQMLRRLRETALTLSGRQQSGPDLCDLLRNLGPEARRGLSEADFAAWLGDQLDRCQSGGLPPQPLVDWLVDIDRRLRPAEEQILTWLKDVTDFRYPVAQHHAAISYFDALVGQIVETLRAQGIYEESTLILTSPHGEILHDRDMYFHHHAIHPQVCAIPMIVKLPGQTEPRPIGGYFGLIDLMPTLLGLLGLEQPAECSGQDYSARVRDGAPLPREYGFVSDMMCLMNGLVRPPHLLIRAEEDYVLSRTWWGKRGEKTLFRMSEEGFLVPEADPETFREMEQILDGWHPYQRA